MAIEKIIRTETIITDPSFEHRFLKVCTEENKFTEISFQSDNSKDSFFCQDPEALIALFKQAINLSVI